MVLNTSIFSSILLFLLISFSTSAQQKQGKEEMSGLFWEISAKDLQNPSYIFGTFHFLNEDYLKNLNGWQEKFEKCEVVVTEIIMDSTKLPTLMTAASMRDNTLDKILSEKDYKKTADFLKEISGVDLMAFNNFNR